MCNNFEIALYDVIKCTKMFSVIWHFKNKKAVPIYLLSNDFYKLLKAVYKQGVQNENAVCLIIIIYYCK